MSVKVTVGQQTFIKKIVLGTPVTTARETLSIDEFTDFNVATKSDAQILVFDSAEGVFKNYTFDVGQGLAREYSPGDDKLTIAIDSDKTPVVTGILSKGNLTPTLDSTFDLGDSNRKWKDLHLSGSTIHLGGIKLKDSGGDFSVKDSTGTPVNIDLAGSIQQIRGFFSPGGDLSYDSATGRFEFDVEQVYTKANFDSDLGDALDGGVGIAYDSASDTIRIDSAELEANFKQDIRGYFTADKGLVYSPTTGNFDVDSANLKTIISATDAGGDGSFSYNNSTGVFTYTGPSPSEVRSHFSAQGDLSYDSTTGVFQFDVEQVYTRDNFESDLGEALAGGVGIAYDSASDTIRIDSAELSAFFRQDIRSYISAVDAGGDGSFSYNATTGVITYTGPSQTEVRAHFTAVDAGGDGSFGYDSASGVFTYTGPSATEVRNHFTGGTGISITAGDIKLDSAELTNLYRQTIRGYINTVDAGGDGSFTYDSSTGQLTYTGPSATEVRNHFTGGDGIGLSSGVIRIDSAELTSLYRQTIRGYLNTVDAGGDGSFAYDSSTGQFTYTGPNATEVRAHFTGGDGIAINAGDIKIDSSELTSLFRQQIRGFINVVDASGDGSFTYDSATGKLTYTGPSASEVRAHFSASNSLSYNSSTGDFRLPQPLDSAANPTFNQLRGPASFVIDPATIGDNTGTVRILGNLQVEGTQTTINSATLSINDKNIVIADSAADSSALDGGGITWGGANIVAPPTFNYSHANARLVSNREINAPLFSGSGASLTNLPAASLTGTIDSARIPTLLIADIGNINSIDHDALTNFVANEHIDHTAVSITAGTGLKGGGTIASTRDLAIDSAELYSLYKHDDFSDFVADEHVAHSGVSITAGFGLKGGGTIASTRDLAIDSSELTTYYRPLIRSYLNVVDAGGDGSFAYDSATGQFTYTGPSATEVRSHFAGGHGIDLVDGNISVDSSEIRGLFSAGGDLSYNSGTGEFSFDVEAVYTKENFDSDYFFAKDSANTAVERNQHDPVTKNFQVTVAAKSGNHVYQGQGSGNAYYVDGTESPIINLKLGRTYRFTLSGSDMSSHPFRFYYDAARNTQYTTGVTTAATYTEITISESTPPVLHYQCSSHGFMGHAVQIGTRNFTGFTTTNLTEGTNLYYTDTRFDNRLATKTTDNLSEGSSNLYYTDARVRAVSLDSAEAQAMIDSNFTDQVTISNSGTIGTLSSNVASAAYLKITDGTNTLGFDGNEITQSNSGNPGALHFGANQFIFRPGNSGSATVAQFNAQSQTELYYNKVKKFETSAYGVTVTGTVNADSATIAENIRADGGNLILGDEALSSNDQYVGMKTSFQSGSNDYMIISGNADGSTYLSAKSGSFVRIRGGGNVSTHELQVGANNARFVGDMLLDSAGAIQFDKSDKALEFGDNYSAIFGAGSDLKIFHNGSNSFIRDQGAGALFVQTSRFIVEDLGSNRIIDGQDGGPVDLYHDGSKKFFTTDSGAEVVGNLITDSATIQGGVLDIKNTGAQSEVRLFCEDANQHYVAVRAPAHSTFSGNVVLTLPSADGTIISTSNSNAPSTTTSAADADFVLIDDGGTMKKITPANLGISSGITIQDSGGSLSTLATTLNFVGAGVVASGSGSTKTITISGGGAGSGSVAGGDTMVQFNDAGAFGADAEFTFNKTSNTLTIGGPLIATSKSFDIKHPTKKGHRLRYGSLEGPENGVYVRGRVNSTKINLPDYWTGLVDEESITVNLTPIGKHQKLYVEDISNNIVTIGNDNLIKKEINCFYTVYAERKDINKITVEYKR